MQQPGHGLPDVRMHLFGCVRAIDRDQGVTGGCCKLRKRIGHRTVIGGATPPDRICRITIALRQALRCDFRWNGYEDSQIGP